MRVLYDASVFMGHSGIERYSRELLRGLLRMTADVHPVLLTTFRRRDDVLSVFDGQRQPEVIPALPNRLMLGPHLQWITHRMKLRAMAHHSAECDLTHVLSPADDPRGLRRFVVSIHDLFPIDPAFSYDGAFEKMFARTIGQYIERSERILVQSAYVASTILERFPHVEAKIRCIPSAASDVFRRVQVDDEILRSLRLSASTPPIVFVGRVDGRKNIPMIVQAYGQLHADVRANHPLVLVISGRTEDVQRFRTEQAVALERYDVRVHVAISTTALVQLLNAAQCMVFPSIAEGFGLPVLEAMQCGCAVITSNRSSLPEVAGDAAILIDPTSVDEIAHAMTRMCTDASLHDAFVQAGLERSAQFTWDRSAELTADVYREACEG